MRLRLALTCAVALLASGTTAHAGQLSWHGPQTVVAGGTSFPAAAIDDQGDTAVAYVDGGGAHVVSRPAAGVFGVAQLLSARGSNPEIAMAGDGTTVVGWVEPGPSGTQYGVHAAVRAAGAPAFSAPVTLVSDGAQSQAHVAMSHDGNAVVTWSDPTGAVVSRRLAGHSFSSPVALGRGDVYDTTVRIDDQADVLAVQGRFVTVGGGVSGPGSAHLETSDLPANATAFSPMQTLADDNGQVFDLAQSANGNTLLTVPNLGTSFARTAHGAWSNPFAFLPQINSSRWATDIDDAGIARVVWSDKDTGEMQLRRRAADGTPGPVVPLAPSSTTDLGGPAAVRQTAQGTLAIWLVDDASHANPYQAALVAADGTVAHETLNDPKGATGYSAIAIGTDGHALVMRTDPAGVARVWVRDTAWPAQPDRGSASLPPVPVADHTAPSLKTQVTQRVAGSATRITLTLTPDKPCLITIQATVEPKGHARKVKLRATYALAAVAGKPVNATLKLPSSLRAKLRRGGTAALTITAADKAGNRSKAKHVTVTLRATHP